MELVDALTSLYTLYKGKRIGRIKREIKARAITGEDLISAEGVPYGNILRKVVKQLRKSFRFYLVPALYHGRRRWKVFFTEKVK
jgi:hypothetical protein